MREVYKNLWIGDENDVARAREKGYAIVSACKDGISSHRQLLGYTSMGAPKSSPEYLVARRKDHLYLNLIDGDDPAYVPDKVIDEALSFISEYLDKGKSVLVHCVEGISRSPSIALLWLVKNGKLPVEGAVRKFKQLYPDYDPSPGIRIYTKQRIASRK